MPNTTATPLLLSDPGFIFWAPLGSAEPANTVTGSVFTDAWPVAWVNLGATLEGSTFGTEQTVEAMSVAELFNPVKYATTAMTSTFAFALANFTAANVKKAMNGGVLTVTGATTTTMTTLEPPDPTGITRCMYGWESLDATCRLIMRQCLNGGNIELAFQRAPAFATIPFALNLEQPAAAKPFQFALAGVARG